MTKGLELQATNDTSGLVSIETARAVQEVQASMIIAKKFPRDVMQAHTRIMKACERKTLAASATYAYPRGKKTVSGPSIRLAEVIAQNWGNLDYGIRELSQQNGESEVEAYAWDIETNTRQTKTFKVPHIRKTKKGSYKLDDPRDIYEMVANQGARRLRACILGIVPGDIVEDAVCACDRTMNSDSGEPIEDQIKRLLVSFSKIGVTQEMIEIRLKHPVSEIIYEELSELRKIGNSMKDGMSKREDWFSTSKTNAKKLDKDIDNLANGKNDNVPEPDPGTDMSDEEIKIAIESRLVENDEHLIEAMHKLGYQNIPKRSDTRKKLYLEYLRLTNS